MMSGTRFYEHIIQEDRSRKLLEASLTPARIIGSCKPRPALLSVCSSSAAFAHDTCCLCLSLVMPLITCMQAHCANLAHSPVTSTILCQCVSICAALHSTHSVHVAADAASRFPLHPFPQRELGGGTGDSLPER